MGVVKQLSDYQRPQREAVERRVAETDNGYTRIANNLLEAILGSKLTQNQMLITLAVIRKTYGYNKKNDWVSNSQLAELTGLPATRCSTIRNELINLNILNSRGREIGINKEITNWKTKVNDISKTFTKPVNKTFTKAVKHDLQDLLTTKDNITKNKKGDPPTPLAGFDIAEQENPGKKPNIPSVPYQAILEAYNQVVGDKLPNAEALNDKRKRSIKRLLSELKEPTVIAAKNYFGAFVTHAKPFYFGQNDTGWQAGFDYLLRSETLLKTREGSL